MNGTDYLRDGRAIYERSFAIIRAEADLSRFVPDEAEVAIRMIHACGEVEAASRISSSRPASSHAARAALAAGAADPLRRRDGGAWHNPGSPAGK